MRFVLGPIGRVREFGVVHAAGDAVTGMSREKIDATVEISLK